MKKAFLLILCLFFFQTLFAQTPGSCLFFGDGPTSVNAIESDATTNSLFAGGDFSGVSGISINNVARWTGSGWGPMGSGINGTVNAMKMYNGELYVAGQFTMAGGQSANCIAKWNGTSWSSIGSGPSPNVGGPSNIQVMEVYNGELYVGGYFLSMDGVNSSAIVKWDGTNWSSLGSGISSFNPGNEFVGALHVFNGELYAGGYFSTAGTTNANSVARWNGTSWQGVYSVGSSNGYIRALADYNGKLIIGGLFTSFGGVIAKNIASWDGSTVEAFGTGCNQYVYTLKSYNCNLYVGGDFTEVDGISASGMAKWNGSAWSIFPDVYFGGGGVRVFHNYSTEIFMGSKNRFLTTGDFSMGSLLYLNSPIPGPLSSTFSSTETNIPAGSHVQFENTTINTTANWEFPGGIPSTSTEQNPIVQYPNLGNFDVHLVTTSCNEQDTLLSSSYVNVSTVPTPLPSGWSVDIVDIGFPENCVATNNTYSDLYDVHYYKPPNYDSLSPILFFIHGSGGSGSTAVHLQDIADRQNALIVAPSMKGFWGYVHTICQDTLTGCNNLFWFTELTKKTYRSVLYREQKDSINVHLTGFSQGGQFTSRYMLLRQKYLDSIPIKMALSSSGYSYTYASDSVYGNPINWPFALNNPPDPTSCVPFDSNDVWLCNGHIQQYYNENLGLMVGEYDNSTIFLVPFQGNNRIERMTNFYNFSDSNAIERGTSLQWVVDTVPNIGHSTYHMYNTFLNPTDSFTIAENILFNTPWHPVPNFLPSVDFSADTTQVLLSNPVVQFTNNSSLGSYLWDFGDGSTSTDVSPSHLFDSVGFYTITLYLTSADCSDSLVINNYIEVVDDLNTSELADHNSFMITPNPFDQTISITYDGAENGNVELLITDIVGREIDHQSVQNHTAISKYTFDTSDYPRSVFFCSLILDGKVVKTKKIIKN